MSSFALVLVLGSAVAHATWNLAAKRAGGGAVFVWLFDTVSLVAVAPIAVATLVAGASLPPAAVGIMAGSSVLHLGYFILLARGYRAGDLSLVYPLARGTGPLLAVAAGILVLGERPHPVAVAGALLVVAGSVALTGDLRGLRRSGGSAAAMYALVCGAFIAAYTLVDKEGVSSAVAVSPVIYVWGLTAGRWLLLGPWCATHRGDVAELWRRHRHAAVAVGVLCPLAYLLVLAALRIAPMSYVAPAREVGVLLGAAMGATLLAERDGRRRVLAAGGMVAGVALLAVG